MKSTHYNDNARPQGRAGEWLGDLTAWQRENGSDNSEQLAHLQRKLRQAREEELTPRQREILAMHFDGQMTIAQIARELGVCSSTVSRTIARAKNRLRRCLQYLL